ncbi:MAG: hypothetical protein ABJB12_05150 [Pseudomonadota bacterium]
MDGEIGKIFVPSRLLGGLAAAILGAGLCAASFALGGSIRVLGVGAVLLIAGVAIAISASVFGCLRCKQAFEETHTAFSTELREQLASAVQHAPEDQGAALSAFRDTPFVPHSVPVSASVELEYCPKCEALGRIRHATRKQLPDGASLAEAYSEPVVLRGAVLKNALRMVGERNTAWQRVAYAGNPSV